MKEPSFELTVNPRRLASWADLPVGLDASDRDLGTSYNHLRYPVLRKVGAVGADLFLMRQGRATEEVDRGRREFAALVSHEDLFAVTYHHRALQRRRCVVPADRILGLRHASAKNQVACRMALRSGGVFGLAAVWQENDGLAPSFWVITTLVSPGMHLFAECMPVVIADVDKARWLDHSIAELPQDLLRPLTELELRRWTLSPNLIA